MDLHIAERQKAGELQERVLRVCREQVIPELTAFCDAFIPADERISLDKMEIDLGTIEENDLEEKLPGLLQEKFELQLKEKLLNRSFAKEHATGSRQIEPRGGTATRTRVELLMHYFKFGSLPWWNPYEGTDINQWIEEEFESDANSLLDTVEQHLFSASVRGRVIRYFSDAQFTAWFSHKLVSNNLRLIETVRKRIPDRWEKVRYTFLDSILSRIKPAKDVATSTVEDTEETVAFALYQLIIGHAIPKIVIDELVSNDEDHFTFFETEEWHKLYAEFETSLDVGSATDRSADEPEANSFSKNEEQFIEVENAGIVLLWPYLNKFFNHLQLLKDEAFVSNDAAQKAVHLLHYISTGQVEGKEHAWPLNKLICGLQPDTFVSEEMELTSEGKQEARALMEAAIGHWETLKNTSLSGFRETFLLRDGIIKPDPRGWKVQVDRETYDILLDRLPWPISIITLPWNDFIIYVEW